MGQSDMEKRYAAAASVFLDGGPQAGGNGLVNRGAPIIILITALKYKNSVFLLRLPSVICLLCIALILWENAISQVAKFFEFPESRVLFLVYILTT